MWPDDQKKTVPDLTDQSGDRLYDLHGRIANCKDMDLVVSTEGNYNMALGEYWQTVFLKKYARDVKSWYYTTSPPISVEQIKNSSLTFGNLDLACRPQIAIGNKKIMKKLADAKVIDGKPVAIKQTRGNVLLVKKGNPKHIKSIWDLGRDDVQVMTPTIPRASITSPNRIHIHLQVGMPIVCLTRSSALVRSQANGCTAIVSTIAMNRRQSPMDMPMWR